MCMQVIKYMEGYILYQRGFHFCVHNEPNERIAEGKKDQREARKKEMSRSDFSIQPRFARQNTV